MTQLTLYLGAAIGVIVAYIFGHHDGRRAQMRDIQRSIEDSGGFSVQKIRYAAEINERRRGRL